MSRELLIRDEYGNQKPLDLPNNILGAIIKASMFKEALASCQMEGIGLDLTIEDLYLAELGYYKSKKKKEQIKQCRFESLNEKENKCQ